MAEPNYDAEMRLPEGKTCGDCFHIRRCIGIGYTSSEANTSCDFWPSRFVAPHPLGARAEGSAQPQTTKEG